jgi:UDP-N-acetylenolpyruvoylglucosamine reductase
MIELIRKAQKAVKAEFDIELENEVQIITNTHETCQN